MRFRFFRTQQLFDVLAHHVGLQIHRIAPAPLAQVGLGHRMRDGGHGKALAVHGGHRQADAVDGNGALFHHIAQYLRPRVDGVPDGGIVPADVGNVSHAVHMARYDMSAEAAVDRHGPFQIDYASRRKSRKGRAVQRLVHHVRRKAIGKKPGHRQADSVHSDAVSDPGLL